ncbi:MAG: LysM peptidoglycan-binding domain-containing protein, partial [Acidimicrobiales bacterium]
MAVLAGQAGSTGPAFSSPVALRSHPVKPGAPVKATVPKTYTVRNGETLTEVARRLGLAVTSLAEANRIADPNRLRIGQVLSLPKSGGPEPVATPALAPLASPVVVVGGGSLHRVSAGENLARIATKYETTVAALVDANNLKNPNLIREGGDLQVPGLPWLCPVQGPLQFSDSWGAPRPAGRRHLGTDVFATRGTPVVASVGGMLEHANGAIAEANRIADPNRLRVGQVLSLPKSGGTEPAATPALAPLASPVVVVGGGSLHRVSAGENLARIATKYET